MAKTNVICVVQVKNESWVLKHFLECAATWSDFIIVLDDGSSDGSRDIALGCEKVKLITLRDSGYDENKRSKLLIDEARKIPGRRVVFHIDADEMLSANARSSPEWNLILDAPEGTCFQLDWLDVLPGLKECSVEQKTVAFVDDDSEFNGQKIHSPKVPATSGKTIKLTDIKLLHYIYVEPQRMFSRHRWYKCFEFIENHKSPWEVCVKYQDSKIKTYNSAVVPLNEEWTRGFSWLNQFKAGPCDTDKVYWWDQEILNYFDARGVEKFRKINIWDADWNKIARLLGREEKYSDCRSGFEKYVHNYIQKHRDELKLRQTLQARLVNRFARTVLVKLGW